MSHPASTKHCDAVVIGAGLAGLTAAAHLSQGGARVLLCEQAKRVGGLFNSFRRDGYLFDGGIKAVGNGREPSWDGRTVVPAEGRPPPWQLREDA